MRLPDIPNIPKLRIPKLRPRKNAHAHRGKADVIETASNSTNSERDHSEKDLGAVLHPMITSFVSDVGFIKAPPGPNKAFAAAMQEYADKTGVKYNEGTHSWKCFMTGMSYASVRVTFHFNTQTP